MTAASPRKLMSMQATATRTTLAWATFAAVAIVAVAVFGFVAFAVLCLVLAAVLMRAGWQSSPGRARVLCWAGASVLLAVPVLTFLEVVLSTQVTTVS